MRYKKVVWELVDARGVKREDLMTIGEAVRMLGVTYGGMQTLVDRTRRFTVFVDTEARARQARRLLLRAEVEAYARERTERH